jgi:hypothetical protein
MLLTKHDRSLTGDAFLKAVAKDCRERDERDAKKSKMQRKRAVAAKKEGVAGDRANRAKSLVETRFNTMRKRSSDRKNSK